MGAFSNYGSVADNVVIIKDSNIGSSSGYVCGGYSKFYGDVKNNTVIINGGKFIGVIVGGELGNYNLGELGNYDYENTITNKFN